MNTSTAAYLRDRELFGNRTTQMEMKAILSSMFRHEYIYDHPLINDIFLYLRDTVCFNLCSLRILYERYRTLCDICEEDQSIVWVAHSYALKVNDCYLLKLTETVKQESL